MFQIHKYRTVDDLSVGFTEFFMKILEGKEVVTVALSGGSTPKALFDYWANSCKTFIPWGKLRFYWGDERCVLPHDPMSNYGMTKEHLLDPLSMYIPPENIFRICGENDPNSEARRYSSILPHIDLVILGIGEDGHTASIYPNQIQAFESPEKCVVTMHPQTNMARITITGQVINDASHVAFLVTGKNKAARVHDVIEHRKFNRQTYPAARVNPISGDLHFFLDSAAASFLD